VSGGSDFEVFSSVGDTCIFASFVSTSITAEAATSASADATPVRTMMREIYVRSISTWLLSTA
jgi:hypothetical protein